jgi:hypothetical protein
MQINKKCSLEHPDGGEPFSLCLEAEQDKREQKQNSKK